MIKKSNLKGCPVSNWDGTGGQNLCYAIKFKNSDKSSDSNQTFHSYMHIMQYV